MIGLIIGDIAGSRFEFNNYRAKDFELFSKDSFVTDDSIMALAVGNALLETKKRCENETDRSFPDLLAEEAVRQMQAIGRPYPHCGFGGRFYGWIYSNDPRPYNSFGNGAAMRVGPVARFAKSEEDVKSFSHAVTAVSHNHPEGLRGAEATAMAAFMAYQGATKDEIRKLVERDYYTLDFTIDAIRPYYRFNETCQDTVPQALQAFFEASSFEDAIRTAVSVGGDSDTLAAITGAVAEAFYGVPEDMQNQAEQYLDEYLLSLYKRWTDHFA
jgi:ADP-ribosyl-[dinitrogen reductase] hydrolase